MVLRLTHFNQQRARDDQFINLQTQRLGRHFFSPFTIRSKVCQHCYKKCSSARTMPTTTAGCYGSHLPNAGKRNAVPAACMLRIGHVA